MKTRKVCIWTVLVAVALMMCVGASAGTDAWIGYADNSAKVAGDQISLEGGSTAVLALYFTSDFACNLSEFTIGYDTSTKSTFGAGGSPVSNKFTLVSTAAEIKSSIDSSVWDLSNTVTLGASARQELNTYLGGRPFGFDVITSHASSASIKAGIRKLFTFKLQSNLASGSSGYVVISVNPGGGAAWSSALKRGSDTSVPAGYALKIVSGSSTDTPVASVSLNRSTLSLTKGHAETLTATVLPADATNKAVTWSSSNTAAVTVSSSGVVTAVEAGSSTVTVTTVDGGYTASCAVTVPVANVAVTGVSLNVAALTLEKGATAELSATISPANATNKAVTWSSSKGDFVTVSATGLLTAVSAGSATITATTTDGGFKATCLVTVPTPVIPVTGVSLSASTISLDQNTSTQLTATVSPENASNKSITWSSSNSTIASVSSSGLVTALDAGSANITATTASGSYTATCMVIARSGILSITTPTDQGQYSTNTASVNIGGLRDASIVKASWQIDQKRKSNCKLARGTWSAREIRLALGDNNIAVTGVTKAKQTYTATLVVNYSDITAPKIRITGPSSKSVYTAKTAVISLKGTASDEEAIASVTWQIPGLNSTTFGSCVGTKSWKAGDVPLTMGENTVIVYAKDTSGNTSSASITVIRADKVKPKLQITYPTMKTSYKTTDSSITLAGTASDDDTIKSLSWVSNRGGSGSCEATSSWTTSEIALAEGSNKLTVTAEDNSGNKTSKTITVTYKPTP